VVEDRRRHGVIEQECEDAESALTLLAHQDVDAVNPTEEVGPGEAAGSVWLTGRIGRRIGDHAGLGVWRGRRLRCGRGVGSTPTTCERGSAAGVGGEDTAWYLTMWTRRGGMRAESRRRSCAGESTISRVPSAKVRFMQ
jgi:hypothetical protein